MNCKCAVLIFFAIGLFTLSCQSNQDINEEQVEFIDQYIIPFAFEADETRVGGLSAIEYGHDGYWYLLSDDRSEYDPARFYKAEIRYDLTGIDTVFFKQSIFLKNRENEGCKFNTVDPEALRFNRFSETFYYSSEGVAGLANAAPFIREMDSVGNFIRELEIPAQFNFHQDSGLRNNGSLESLAFENDSILWFANELPLIEDGSVPGFGVSEAPVRLSKFNVKSNQLISQYAYMLEPVPAKPLSHADFHINSVVELLSLDDDNLLVMERSYIANVGNYVKVFKVSFEQATDISKIQALKDADYQPLTKKLLIDFSDYSEPIDNVEGMSFGEKFSDGRRSLLFVTDNNFSESQQTQIWLFATEGL